MAEYDNKNRFTLFRNTKKREGKNDADFNGTFTDENGREYWMNAWTTSPKNGGDKFLSGSIKVKEKKEDAPASRAAPRAKMAEDEIPF